MRRKNNFPTITVIFLIVLSAVIALSIGHNDKKEEEKAPAPLAMMPPHPGAQNRPDLCPPNFAYFAGGQFTATRVGERWSEGIYKYEVTIEPFCLAKYEASIPRATANTQDDVHMADRVLPAQVKSGVKPWSGANWYHALAASTLQGWELPTYEELQYVATSGDPTNRWVWGPEWDCRYSERSWSATCLGPRTYTHEKGYGITGGPFSDSNYHLPVYDLHGNLAEWTATPWDENCYGMTRFLLFGGNYTDPGGKQQRQVLDGKKEGCWKTEEAGTDNFSGQDQDIWMRLNHGGFRPKAKPGNSWKKWRPKTDYEDIAFPIKVRYFDASGKKTSFDYDPISEMKQLNEQAEELITQGQYTQAMTLLRKSMDTYPYSEETQQLWNHAIQLKNMASAKTESDE